MKVFMRCVVYFAYLLWSSYVRPEILEEKSMTWVVVEWRNIQSIKKVVYCY